MFTFSDNVSCQIVTKLDPDGTRVPDRGRRDMGVVRQRPPRAFSVRFQCVDS